MIVFIDPRIGPKLGDLVDFVYDMTWKGWLCFAVGSLFVSVPGILIIWKTLTRNF